MIKNVNLYIVDSNGNEFVSRPFTVYYDKLQDLHVLVEDIWEIIGCDMIIGDIYLNEVTCNNQGKVLEETPLANASELRVSGTRVEYSIDAIALPDLNAVLRFCVREPLAVKECGGFVRRDNIFDQLELSPPLIKVAIYGTSYVSAQYKNGCTIDWPVAMIDELCRWSAAGKNRGNRYGV